MFEDIRERLRQVQQRVAKAAERSGRKVDDITLIAVSKTFDTSTVQLAIDAGVRHLGENRVQEAAGKVNQVKSDGLRWHLIGHLQSNKARQAALIFDVIHTLDSVELVRRLDRIAGDEGKRPTVLAQVDLGRETTKSGVEEGKLPELVEALDSAQHLAFRGLMTLPPFFDSPELTRGYFQRLRELLGTLNRNRQADRRLVELSMGMSNDFEVAIEEGATMIRVGTAIFGSRVGP